jgi:hypothetical protein
MFEDPRIGHGKGVPNAGPIPTVSLSRERCLHVRCTSPHERGETVDEFFDKLNRACRVAKARRFNYACALQPGVRNKAPAIVDFCEEFISRLAPERLRVAQINPHQDGVTGAVLSMAEIDQLRALEVDVLTIDGRRGPATRPNGNGLLLADFFDFT